MQNRLDGVSILPDLSIYWKNISFQDIWVESRFKVSAKVEGGKVTEIRVKATREGILKLNHNLGEKYTLNNLPKTEKVLEKNFKTGEEVILVRTN